jgi:dTDP-4-amino-4,6-dideoxygalactose transaminase
VTIPLHRPWFDDAEEAAVIRVLQSGRLAGNGRECAALEQELRARLGNDRSVVALSSATHALELAMLLLDVAGGEVILPSFTFPSVGSAVLRAGGTIRFCEVREPDLNVDLDHARSLVGPSTRALVVTHYAGHPQQVSGSTVPIVEDAAHALGSLAAGRPCATLGEFGCLSFHATKNVAAGEGGALVARDDSAATRARIFREKGTNRDDFMAGRIDHYAWVGLGSSFVMPELSAAIARVQLAKIDAITEARRRIAAAYDAALADLERDARLAVVRPTDEGTSSHHIYAVLIDPPRRARVLGALAEAGVQAASHFVPLHASPFGRTLIPSSTLPRTDRLAASIVRLPIYPGLCDGDIDRITSTLRRALDG